MHSMLAHTCWLLLTLAASLSHQSPIAHCGRGPSDSYNVSPKLMAFAVSEAGYLYTGSPHFLISQYDYANGCHEATPKNVMPIPLMGSHMLRLNMQAATEADGAELLALTGTYTIQDYGHGGLIASHIYQISNTSSQPGVELCTIPEYPSWAMINVETILDGKHKRLYYAERRESSLQLKMMNLVTMKSESTGLPAPCPSLTIDLPPQGTYGSMVYDSSRDTLLLAVSNGSIPSLQMINGTTGTTLGVLALSKLSGSPLGMKLDTSRSILYCHTRNERESLESIHVYDLSDQSVAKLVNVYPFPDTLHVHQMEVDNKLGVLHVTTLANRRSSPWHWTVIAPDCPTPVMNKTFSDTQVDQFVLHNSELGFYGKRSNERDAQYCLYRFAFEYDTENAIGSAIDSMDLNVVCKTSL